jgi:hypothetical protein
MVPVELFQESEERQRRAGSGEFSIWYIVRTFVNATVYPHPAQQLEKKNLPKKKNRHDFFKKDFDIVMWEKWLFRGMFGYFYIVSGFIKKSLGRSVKNCNWLNHVINKFLICEDL